MHTERCKIVVTNRVHTEVLDYLGAAHDVDANQSFTPWTRPQLQSRARDADALMVFMPDRVDAAFLEQTPRLRIIAGALKGYDNFDRRACTESGVWLTNVPDLLTGPTAELALGLMIAVSRNLLAGDRHVRSGAFTGWRAHLYGTSLAGSDVGIIGMGAVGRAVAKRLRGFDANVLYADHHAPDPDLTSQLAITRVAQSELLRRSHFVVLATHLTQDTMHMINQATLASMRQGSFLINPGRGSLVDEAAVADALRRGHLAGYAADVFEMEDWARSDRPEQIDAGLLEQVDQTVLTPHIGSAVARTRYEIEMAAARNILECLAGRRPPDAVNDPSGNARRRDA